MNRSDFTHSELIKKDREFDEEWIRLGKEIEAATLRYSVDELAPLLARQNALRLLRDRLHAEIGDRQYTQNVLSNRW